MLWRPQQPRMFSFFFAASLEHEVWLLFALCAFVYLCLLVGWRTRLFHVLSLVVLTSLHDRILYV